MPWNLAKCKGVIFVVTVNTPTTKMPTCDLLPCSYTSTFSRTYPEAASMVQYNFVLTLFRKPYMWLRFTWFEVLCRDSFLSWGGRGSSFSFQSPCLFVFSSFSLSLSVFLSHSSSLSCASFLVFLIKSFQIYLFYYCLSFFSVFLSSPFFFSPSPSRFRHSCDLVTYSLFLYCILALTHSGTQYWFYIHFEIFFVWFLSAEAHLFRDWKHFVAKLLCHISFKTLNNSICDERITFTVSEQSNSNLMCPHKAHNLKSNHSF